LKGKTMKVLKVLSPDASHKTRDPLSGSVDAAVYSSHKIVSALLS